MMRNAEKVTFLPLKNNTSHERLRYRLNLVEDHLRGSLNILISPEEADLTCAHLLEGLYPQLKWEFPLRIIPPPRDTRKIKTSDITSTLRTTWHIDSKTFAPLSRKDLALQFFDRKLGEIPEEINFYYSVRKVENRPPGYIIDLMIAIPASDRKLEYRIYSALKDLTTKYVDLLFNFRIIRRRGRPLHEIVSEGYQRYV